MSNRLHQLLQEDQEPFHLQDYINDRRRRLQPRRPKPASGASFTTKICKKACFFSGTDSPEVNQSPGVCKNSKNVIFLHVPAKTAEMLLEASARIRKPSKLDASKRLGLFLKKLKRSSGDKRKESEEEEEEVGVSLKDILKGKNDSSSTAFIGRSVTLRQNPTFSPEIPDIKIEQNLEFRSSPFHFVLQNDSYNHQTPPDSSSSTSSAETENCDNCDEKDSFEQCGNEEKAEDEEHCSPVSVLDPDPYEEEVDIEERHEEDEEDDETCSFDMDRSYANVQRAQERLLEKLARFERLAELDPLELEIRLQEDEQEEDFSDGFVLSEEEGNLIEAVKSSSNKRALSYIDQLVIEVLKRPELKTLKRVPAELRKVTRVILNEEELKLIAFDDKSILLERVVLRLAPWKEMAGDGTNMIVSYDTIRDLDEFARKQEQVTEAAMDIEYAIFEALIMELCKELAS